MKESNTENRTKGKEEMQTKEARSRSRLLFRWVSSPGVVGC